MALASSKRLKAIVLLSSGLDSLVNLAWASRHFKIAKALTFDYGQRAAKREISNARLLAMHYGLTHLVIRLPELSSWTTTALIDKRKNLPRLSEKTLNNRALTRRSAEAVWVPNRNGIFINVAAALAESLGARHVIVGFNREEGATFPDNSPPFVNAANKSLFYSTLNHVRVIGKTLAMTKPDIVRLGIKLKAPWHLVWSCYEDGMEMCGLCESCLRLKRAAKVAAPRLLEVFHFAN